MKCRFLIIKRIDKPLISGMKGVIYPSPARCAIAYGIPVISLNRGPDIQEIWFNSLFDDHA
jgi:hypothetical protein